MPTDRRRGYPTSRHRKWILKASSSSVLPSGHQKTYRMCIPISLCYQEKGLISWWYSFLVSQQKWLRKVGKRCSFLSLTREIWGNRSKEKSIFHYRIWKVNCKLEEKMEFKLGFTLLVFPLGYHSHSEQRHYWQLARKLLLTLNFSAVLPFTFKQHRRAGVRMTLYVKEHLLKKNGKSISILQKNLPQSLQLLLGHWQVGQQTPALAIQ